MQASGASPSPFVNGMVVISLAEAGFAGWGAVIYNESTRAVADCSSMPLLQA